LHQVGNQPRSRTLLVYFFNLYVILAMTHDHFVGCVLEETFFIFKHRMLKS